MRPEIAREDLVVGGRYDVEMRDCCIQGEFTATVTELVLNEGYIDRIAFDNGVTFDQALRLNFYEPA